VVALWLAWAAGGAVTPSQTTAPRPAVPAGYDWQLPVSFPIPVVPAGNPMLEAKVQLGRRLFYDKRLSGTGTFACATCHQQARAFTDGRAQALGSLGEEHRRSTMSLTNAGYNASLGWADGSRLTLEDQMAVPMFNAHPVEMGIAGREEEVTRRFAADPAYLARFKQAFPQDSDPVTLDTIVKAIAAFERTLVSGDSPFDRYLYRDDRGAMPEPAVRGMTLFFSDRLRCAGCHAGFNLSGPVAFEGGRRAPAVFHHTGLYDVDGRGSYPSVDRGLLEITKRPADMGRFRAPTLRNIAVTAPYMHDGSLPTLASVVSHYAAGGHASRLRSAAVAGFTMTPAETADLIAFLESLTDSTFLTNPRFSDPAGPEEPVASAPK
jgi:cytochrome c peroxidase